MEDKIELTPQELENIKNEERFREYTAITLKTILKRLDKQNGSIERLIEKSIRHDVHINIHYALIFMIVAGLVGFAWKVVGTICP